MSQLYSYYQVWYNYNCLGYSFFVAQDAVFLFDNIIESYYPSRNRVCAVNKLQRAFDLDTQSTGAVFAFVQSNRKEKAQVTEAPEPLKGLTYMSVKTVSMIARLKAAVNTRIPILSQPIPSKSSGNYLASDLMFLSLVRRDEPGLSSLFPLMAASIVDALMPGAASPLFSKRS